MSNINWIILVFSNFWPLLKLKVKACVVRSSPCQSIWDAVSGVRGSALTWLSSLCCCPSSQRYRYDSDRRTKKKNPTKFQFKSPVYHQYKPLTFLWTTCLCHQTDLYSGALFVQVCLGWNQYLSTILMLVVTALYTIAGICEHTHTH